MTEDPPADDIPKYVEPERRADATTDTLPPEAPEEETDEAADLPAPTGQRRKRRKRSAQRNAVEWAIVLVGAVVIALVIKTFLIQAFYIPSASMEPTLHQGDRVLVNKVSYDLHDVNRGDVVVFKRPSEGQTVESCDGSPITIPAQPSGPGAIEDLIKRVVALPGETVEQRDGRIYIEGNLLEEPYVQPGSSPRDWEIGENCIRVPEGRVWVMGDNRGNSQASNAFGPVEESSIVGRAFVRVWPLGDIGGL